MPALSKLTDRDWSEAAAAPGLVYRLSAGGDGKPGSQETAPADLDPVEHEDLPYRVEVWNEAKTVVNQVLAVTVNASIGYAAYYEAIREFPQRYVTLRHKNAIVTRWNPPQH